MLIFAKTLISEFPWSQPPTYWIFCEFFSITCILQTCLCQNPYLLTLDKRWPEAACLCQCLKLDPAWDLLLRMYLIGPQTTCLQGTHVAPEFHLYSDILKSHVPFFVSLIVVALSFSLGLHWPWIFCTLKDKTKLFSGWGDAQGWGGVGMLSALHRIWVWSLASMSWVSSHVLISLF